MRIRGEYPAGQRVRLIHCTDVYTELRQGDEGTVFMVDDAGTWHINWDSGSRLGLVRGEDLWEILPDKKGS